MSNTLLAENYTFEELVANLVTEDDEPVDNMFSAKQQRLLVDSLYVSWKIKKEDGEKRPFYCDENVGVFFSVHESPLVPDVFVSLDIEPNEEWKGKSQRSYFVWEFGKLPEIVIEIVSNKKGNELESKMKKYAKWGVDYYVIFDPFQALGEEVVRVHELFWGKRYRQREDFEMPEVGLSLTLWEGEFEGWQETWLRWENTDGNLLLTGKERSEMLEAKLRELGVEE